MYDDPDDRDDAVLSHDLPCPRCGHATHTFLACGGECDCRPALLPGDHRRIQA